jgi:pantothenate synthetase
LTDEDKARAPSIYKALQWAESAAEKDEVILAEQLAAEVRRRIASAGGTIDYVEASPFFCCVVTLRNLVVGRFVSFVSWDISSVLLVVKAGDGSSNVQVVDASTLQPVHSVKTQHTLIAVAAFFGKVRLIDNVVLCCGDETQQALK